MAEGESHTEKKNVPTVLVAAISSWGSLGRFFILLLLLTLSLTGIGEFVFRRLAAKEHVSVSFTKEGATLVFDQEKQVHATMLIPASSRWIPSGITVEPEATVRITASGRVNLAVHHLIKSAKDDTKPLFGWVGPEGYEFLSPRSMDLLRWNLLVDPKSNMGSLLACMRVSSEPPPSIPRNIRPSGMRFVGRKTEFKNRSKEKVELWFCVNDTVLDPNRIEESEKAYRSPEAEKGSKLWKTETKRWNYITANSYWDLWWDDNIGQFIVLVEITMPEKKESRK